MTEINSGKRADLTFSSRCPCGAIYTGDWCLQCLKRFGDERKSVADLSVEVQKQELILVLRPIAVPLSYRMRRYIELAMVLKPAESPSLKEFLKTEAGIEQFRAKQQNRTPAFSLIQLPGVPVPRAPAAPPPVIRSFVHGVDPSAPTIAGIPAVGSGKQPLPIMPDVAVPEAITLDAYPGTKGYRSGGESIALAPPLPPPADSQSVSLRRSRSPK